MLYLSNMKKKIIYLFLVLFLGYSFKNLYYDVYDSEVISVNSNLKYHTITFKEGKTSFEVTKNKENYDFFVNSNFFTKRKEVIGFGGLCFIKQPHPKQLFSLTALAM